MKREWLVAGDVLILKKVSKQPPATLSERKVAGSFCGEEGTGMNNNREEKESYDHDINPETKF